MAGVRLALLLICFTCVAWGGCPHSGWRYRDGYCYKMFELGKTRQRAEASCNGKTAFHHLPCHLVSIHSHDENDFIRGMVTHNKTAWIGFKDNGVEDGWFQWSDESRMDFTNWLEGQPDDMQDNTEDCVIINQFDTEELTKVGYWGDEQCQNIHPYVCKLKAV